MTSPAHHAVYGQPPASLVSIPADTAQYSPLIPGSETLESCPDASLNSATLYAPAATIERRYVIAQFLRTLTEGAPLTVLAANDKGGTRIARELEAFGCSITTDSKQHHRICRTTRPATLALGNALTEGAPRYLDTIQNWTQPGLFSWDRIDPGTQLLLQHIPSFTGSGADIGCGLGILSQAVLRSPAITALTLIDIDRRAIHAAQQNITDPRSNYLWGDARTALLPNASLDFVIMNPPFHDTGIEDHSLGQQLIARAADALKKTGTCWIVANRHLPYEQLLTARFAKVTPIATADGFKVIAAENPHG